MEVPNRGNIDEGATRALGTAPQRFAAQGETPRLVLTLIPPERISMRPGSYDHQRRLAHEADRDTRRADPRYLGGNPGGNANMDYAAFLERTRLQQMSTIVDISRIEHIDLT